MQTVTIKVEGLAELDRNINRLRDDYAKKAVVAAVRKGANIFKKTTLANIRKLFTKRTGLLLGGITQFFRIKSLGVKGSIVRIRIGLRKSGESPWYGRLLESGWRHIGRGRGGSRTLRSQRRAGSVTIGNEIPARPFMQTAFESEKNRVFETIRQELAAQVSRFHT